MGVLERKRRKRRRKRRQHQQPKLQQREEMMEARRKRRRRRLPSKWNPLDRFLFIFFEPPYKYRCKHGIRKCFSETLGLILNKVSCLCIQHELCTGLNKQEETKMKKILTLLKNTNLYKN